MERRLWTGRLCAIICIIISIPGGSSAKEASACFGSFSAADRVDNLTCDDDKVIKLVNITVAHSHENRCVPDQSGCAFSEVNVTDKYYIDLSRNCTDKTSCQLSSGVLRYNYNFTYCGASRVRSIAKVHYSCIANSGSTASPTKGQITSVKPGTDTPTGTDTATGPDTATAGETDQTDPISTNPVTAESRSTDGELKDIVVKIVAPILGVLTVAALIVLVVCLKRKRGNTPSREGNKSDREQTNTYEDVTGPFEVEEEDAYYSEPREDNQGNNQRHLTPNIQDKNETGSSGSVQQRINRNDRPVAGNQKVQNRNDGNRLKQDKSLADEDDGFYDTVSDETDYDLAEPVRSDNYAEIRKEPKENTMAFVIHDIYSEANPQDHQRCSNTPKLETNDVSTDPTRERDTVLITNDLYEHTYIGEDEAQQVTELIENDLYSSS